MYYICVVNYYEIVSIFTRRNFNRTKKVDVTSLTLIMVNSVPEVVIKICIVTTFRIFITLYIFPGLNLSL